MPKPTIARLDAELAKKGRFYECNHYFLRSACRSVHSPAALLDTQETTDRRVPIPKNVPVLRIDHIPIQGTLFGVWRGKRLMAVGWPDCEEMNCCFLSPSGGKVKVTSPLNVFQVEAGISPFGPAGAPTEGGHLCSET